MTRGEHTPGPWDLSERGDYGDYGGDCRVILDGDLTERLAVVHWNPYDPDTSDANARLIAAAPDLLSALERLQRNFDLLLAGKPVRDVAEMRAETDAAIAKAVQS